MPRSIPPTGAPIEISDILAGIWATRKSEQVELFREEICRYFGTKHSFLLSSGKAALSVALEALSRISDRREVVIPAFSSFCLPSAVAKAGLNIRLCDVSPETLDFDLDRLKETITPRTLCVIPVHLFGLPARVDEIRTMAKAQGAYVIEDAAQAAGGRLKERKLGTIGDIGVFSLGRGKNITTVDGGIIVTDSDILAAEVQVTIKSLSRGRAPSGAMAIKALALSLFLRPRLYWFPERLPFLNLGASEFSTSFVIEHYSAFQAGIGQCMLDRLDRYNAVRQANAAYLMEVLQDIPGIRIPRPIPDSCPVYLRFPLLVDKPAAREMVYQSLAKQGLGVSKTYPSALNAIEGLRQAGTECPGAEEVARKLLTLPTHPYVNFSDLERMTRVLVSSLNHAKVACSSGCGAMTREGHHPESIRRWGRSNFA